MPIGAYLPPFVRRAGLAFAKSLEGAFAYDAVKNNGRRRPADGIVRSADAELNAEDRRRLLSDSRTIEQNFSVVGWMVRKHLDYTTTFSFDAKSGDDYTDQWLEDFVAEWSQPENFDAAHRMDMDAFLRVAEGRRCIDGDCGLLKLENGQLQAIEGDRIRTPYNGLPNDVPKDEVIHGVHTDVYQAGRALAYAVCRRAKTTDYGQIGLDFQFERMVPVRDMLLYASFDRFDQTRGISPLAAGLNPLKDLYEGFDYTLGKIKLAQLFGLVLFRGDPDSITKDTYDEEEAQDYSKINLNSQRILDLDVGDRAEFLESRTPAADTAAFFQQMLALTLKTFDIPYSFYNESFSTYSGSRQALLMYEQSAHNSRKLPIRTRNHLLKWRLAVALLNNQIPSRVKIELMRWSWIHAGLPWIDPLKEITADLAAVRGRLASRTQICRLRGTDFYQIVDELAREEDYMRKKSVSVSEIDDKTLSELAHAAEPSQPPNGEGEDNA
ncbi:phage portal protein [Planctopirus hydrillae]|uniref:Phage portal protein n=1 Tax=Planctopirus hydrillae TaxID=1841610 RepID=A0A1C3E490_9PLAN|nr:phage portal protein [Planctopirus hydrillae]ODA28065.1 hypothetical protein A6X21_14485 [Planctopirus hydrillae]